MQRRAHFSLFLILALFTAAIGTNAKDAPAKSPQPEIRSFDIEILARLGREIYQHDQLAWKATDVLLAQVGEARMKKDGFQGWIVDTSSQAEPLVRFLRVGINGLEVACDVVFPSTGSPRINVPADRKLSPEQTVNARALETAKRDFVKAQYPWCGGNPNTVVLNDPLTKGFLVYFLRAKPSADEVPIGGHYRFSVSPDGQKVTQVDRLFASCLTMNRKDPPKGGKLEALVASHVISPTPLETHVFLSLQEKLPFAIITMDGTIWTVDQGQIGKAGKMENGKVVIPEK